MFYLVVDILPSLFRVSLFNYNSASKKIVINFIRRFNSRDDLLLFLRSQNYRNNYPVLLNLDASLSATEFNYQKLYCRDYKTPLDSSQIESLITQLIWRCLPAHQIYIRSIMIDGHRVADPRGLSGREIEFYFSRALVEDQLFNDLQHLFSLVQIKLIGNGGCFWAHVLSQTCGLKKPFFLAALFYDVVDLFLYKDGKITHYRRLKWGERNLLSVLFGRLSANQQVGREVLRLYCSQSMSSYLLKQINKFFEPEFNQLRGLIQRFLAKEKINQIYLLPFLNLPANQIKWERGIYCRVVDNSLISKNFGYRLKFKREEDKSINYFPIFSLIAELESIPFANLINRLTSRRLCWANSQRKNKITKI